MQDRRRAACAVALFRAGRAHQRLPPAAKNTVPASAYHASGAAIAGAAMAARRKGFTGVKRGRTPGERAFGWAAS